MDETSQEISVCNRYQHFSWAAYPARCPIEVPVKTESCFDAVFTGSRGDGRLEELLVEIGTNAVEKVSKTTPIFK